MHFLILAIFFVSGLCGLIYEIVWSRQLTLVFGTTTLSTSTILAIFMGGLGLGSWWLGGKADDSRNPLKFYAFLEAGIGLCALILIYIFPRLPGIYAPIMIYFSGSYRASVLFRFLICAVLLLVPTTLMGGTLPILARFFIRNFSHLGKRIGSLYAINTLGAVAGSFLSGFFLLHLLGSAQSTMLAAITNLLLSVFSYLLGRSITAKPIQKGEIQKRPELEALETQQASPPAPVPLVLFIFGVSGFAALAYEVFWTRILVFVLGSHTYAFTTMLMAFLTGIALGGFVFSRVADRTSVPSFLLFLLQAIIGFSALFLIVIFRKVPEWFTLWATLIHTSWWKFAALEFSVCLLLMLLPTFCMGGTFPLVMKLYVSDLKKRGRQIGRSYLVNTIGSILGAFLSGFVFIPWLGIQKGIVLVAIFNIVFAILLILLTRSITRLTKWAAVFAALVLLFTFLGRVPLHFQLQSLGPEEKLLFYEEHSSATVAVKETSRLNGSKVLTVNGLEEVPLDYVSMQTFRFLGHFPLLIHPDPEKILVISFGAGIATGSASLHPGVEIDAVEICPAVPRAAAFFSRENHRVLQNSRVRMILLDGRNYVATTGKNYDIITADATHPWSADSWVLYTEEFYRSCKNHLNRGGVMVQWLPLHWLPPEDYQSLLRTFKKVFPHTSLWFTNSYTVLVGTPQALRIDFAELQSRLEDPAVQDDLAQVGMGEIHSLLAFFMMGEEQIDRFLRPEEINTDDRPGVEFSAPRSFGLETTSLNLSQLAPFREQVMPYLIHVPETQKTSVKLEKLFHSRSSVLNARILHFQRHFGEEISLYERATAENPEDPDGSHLRVEAIPFYVEELLAQARRMRSKGDYEQAVDLYKKTLRFDPQSSKSYNDLGVIYFGRKDYAEALEAYLQAAKINPDQAEIRYNLAVLYLVTGEYEKAQAEVRQLLRARFNLFQVQKMADELEKKGYAVR